MKGLIEKKLFTGLYLKRRELVTEEVHAFIVKVVNHSLEVAMYELRELTHGHLQNMMQKHRGKTLSIFIAPIFIKDNLIYAMCCFKKKSATHVVSATASSIESSPRSIYIQMPRLSRQE